MEVVEQNYGKGEIVWAKLQGHPWWPGAIADIDINLQNPSASLCIVKFFGENTHSVLSLTKIAKYSQFFSKHQKKASTNKKLQESIEIADKILKGLKDVKKQLAHVKTKLNATTSATRQCKTAVTIEEHANFYSQSVESNQVSCCPEIALAPKSFFQAKDLIEDQTIRLDQDDQLVLQELEIQGINQQNIISVLEYGVIKRLSLVDKQKGSKLKDIAKEVLIRKYFSKGTTILEEIQQDKQVQQKKQKSVKSLKLLKEDRQSVRKRIHKQPKKVRIIMPNSQVQILCVKRIYSILKNYIKDSESCRSISSSIVSKLKIRNPIQSTQFQRQYLSFIEWVKCHCDQPKIIANYQDHYFEQNHLQDQASKRSESTEFALQN